MCRLALAAAGLGYLNASLESLDYPDVLLCPYATEDDLNDAAENDGGIWGAVVFDEDSLPLSTSTDTWKYTLRFNLSSVPSTRTTFDRFASGISKRYYQYYSSGFLSLQSDLNSKILNSSAARSAVPPGDAPARDFMPYGAPLLIEAYKHNTFFDFAGNLIGMLVIFSFLIPLSTMLRALLWGPVLGVYSYIYTYIHRYI